MFGESNCRTTGNIIEGVQEWKSKVRFADSLKLFTLMLRFWLLEISLVVVESYRPLVADSMAKAL
jgi:hypothetical protein